MKSNQTIFLKLCLADALIKLLYNMPYDDISINMICETAGVGRTTYYRHLDKRNGKEDLIVFKIIHDLNEYNEKHKEEVNKDSGLALLNFIYENKKLFEELYKNNLVTVIMRIFDESTEWKKDRNNSYLRAFFVYGYFGVIYEWIRYGFDEDPKEVQKHIVETILQAQTKKEAI